MESSKGLTGEMLLKEGYISSTMLECALKVQESSGGDKIGETLRSLGFVTDVEIAKTMARQAGLKFFALDQFRPKVDVLKQLNQQHARKYNILPLFVKNGQITVAVADPFDATVRKMVSQYLSSQSKMVVSPLSRLQRAIENSYFLAENSLDGSVNGILRELRGGDELRTEDLIEYLNRTAVELNASDMHISATKDISFVSYRVDGVLQLRYTFPGKVHSRLISAYKLDCGMDITETMRPQDGNGKFEFLGSLYELRVSSMPTTNGENLVVRYLTTSQEFKSIEDLGFTKEQQEVLKKYLDSPSGVILCTGPTGSGKTTTLYSLIRRTDYIQKNVLTVEDPVEFKIPLIKQVSVNEKAGMTFANSIRSFLRQDPDVILIGEIRDEDTAQLAIRAAQTGHLMLSSLHTNDAVGSIARLRDLGVGNYLIATTLSCIVAQRLVRKLCPLCKQKAELEVAKATQIGLKSRTIYRKKGCDNCFDTGYLGRTAVAEVLEFSPALRSMIDKGDSPIDLREQAEKDGLKSLKSSVRDLVEQGLTDDEEYFRVTYD